LHSKKSVTQQSACISPPFYSSLKPSIIPLANMRDEDGDGFYEVHVKYDGRFLVVIALMGYAPIAVFRKKNCRCIWFF
jgi:hypothetical protein